MMAELWSDIEEVVASSCRHFTLAVRLFRSERFDPQEPVDYDDEMALLHAMQSGFSSFEAALKRLFGLLGEELPQGSDPHAMLLQRARRAIGGSRPAILDETLFRAADRLRGFRHVAVHTDDHFDRDRAALAVDAAQVFADAIGPAMAKFRGTIDPA